MKSKSGFTLVELLIVIVVIGILAGIGYVSYGHVRRMAYDAKVDAALNQAEKAVIAFNLKNTPPHDRYWNIATDLKSQGYLNDQFFNQLKEFSPIARYGGVYATHELNKNEINIIWCGNKKYLVYADSYSGGISESELRKKWLDCECSKQHYIDPGGCMAGYAGTGKERHFRIREVNLGN